MNWKRWMLGILNAGVSGAANAAAAMFVDPDRFNLEDGLPRLASMAAVGAIIGVVMYLRASPLPQGWDGSERRNNGSHN